jgi:hypothetical protein
MFSPIIADCCVAATVISAQVTSRNATIMARPLSQAQAKSLSLSVRLFSCRQFRTEKKYRLQGRDLTLVLAAIN